MREIKFRVFDNDTKTMHVCGGDSHDTINFSYPGNQAYYYNLQNGEGSLKDDKGDSTYELMQYTGLKDKNGKEIYEGDIIEFNNNDYARTAGHLDDEIIIAEVEYYCGHYGLKEANGQLHDLYIAIVNDDEAEIIGNIYENPELLEGEN